MEGGLVLVGILLTSLYWWGSDVLVCRGVVAWCGWVGVVECDCCFLVIERFLEGRGELEFVVEFVDGDEGSETFHRCPCNCCAYFTNQLSHPTFAPYMLLMMLLYVYMCSDPPAHKQVKAKEMSTNVNNDGWILVPRKRKVDRK